MKTVLIHGNEGVPMSLGQILARGSTELVERDVDELEGRAPAADRLVFWSGTDDERLRRLAEACAKDAPLEQGERVMFVLADTAAAAGRPELPPDQLFIWPRDEDRLKLMFLTGA